MGRTGITVAVGQGLTVDYIHLLQQISFEVGITYMMTIVQWE